MSRTQGKVAFPLRERPLISSPAPGSCARSLREECLLHLQGFNVLDQYVDAVLD
jgi:hypothetical protein